LLGHRERHEIEHGTSNERRGVFTDDPPCGVEDEDRSAPEPIRGVLVAAGWPTMFRAGVFASKRWILVRTGSITSN
jgi:hypothetical protein